MTSISPSYLAFDLGASSGRVVLGTLDEGVMYMEEVYRFETPLVEDGERLYWDLEALWAELQEGLQRGRDAAANVKSLSVDSWAVDYVPLDENGAPLRNPYCYRDPRTQDVMDWALDYTAPEEIYATTGIQFLPINTLYQVLADRKMEPERVTHTAQRLLIADYFNYRFGGRPVAELSMASTTQLMNVQTSQWAMGLMRRFGIDPATWPEIVPSATKLGSLVTDGRQSTIEIVAGCSHDTACAVAAVPAEDDGPPWAYISCGTWSLFGVERADPLLGDAAREAGFTNEIGLDGSVRFLKNLTGLWPLQECVRVWEENGSAVNYATLMEEAAQAPAAQAPAAQAQLDLEEAQFRARGDMPERIRAYCRETAQSVPETRGAITRILLESLAASYRRTLDALEDVTGQSIDTIHLVGGGSNNELLCQLAADACECRVVAGPDEATALGNLLIQARTMGDLPPDRSVRDVARRTSDLSTYHPQPAQTEKT